MAWTRTVYPCLKPWGQQLTKIGKKENYKHFSFPWLQTLTAEVQSQLFKM